MEFFLRSGYYEYSKKYRQAKLLFFYTKRGITPGASFQKDKDDAYVFIPPSQRS
jgi:hypothetical protein